jgi:hypothetical protein
LFLDDANAPNCQKNNGFSDLGNYSEWPKVAGAVIQARLSTVLQGTSYSIFRDRMTAEHTEKTRHT